MQKKIYFKNHLIQKKWGQVFLHNQNDINSIVKIMNLKKNQKIIEIGPGLGALTKKILNIVDSLVVIEQDTNLVDYLTKHFNTKQLRIFHQNVLTINFFNISNQLGGKIRLIGNLPYNIAIKLIIHLLQYIDVIDDMHFMLQKEVANRIISSPNKKEYGRLSIIAQYYCKITPLLEVSSASFFPIPKVKSMMIKLLPHAQSPYPAVNIKQLSSLTALAFAKRRKIIKNSLSIFFNTKTIEIPQEINLQLRAENLTILQYCALTLAINNTQEYIQKNNNTNFIYKKPK